MKIASVALVILLSGNLWAGPSLAEMSSVILSEDKAATIVIGKAERQTPYTISFPISQMTPLLPPDPKVLRCELRIVASLTAGEKLSDQDVAVFSNDQQIGQWSAYYKQPNGPANGPVPYRVGLDPEFCKPIKELSLKLKNLSEATNWTYFGGGAGKLSDQPRLIVSFESPATASGTGLTPSTTWKYDEPNGAFGASLAKGLHLLTNPVFWNGALYFANDEGTSGRLFRLIDRTNTADWPLNVSITPGSFAFVTPQGRLEIVTRDFIYYCDLSRLSSTEPVSCTTLGTNTTIDRREPPVMSEDGSLYLKNLADGGALVGYNSLRQKLWVTPFKATRVSPTTLSDDGLYAFVLASIDKGSVIATAGTYLLRIDTATGEIIWHEITVPDKTRQPQIVKRPSLDRFLKPIVVSRRIGDAIADYVIVGGTGLLQLYASVRREDGQSSELVQKWTDEETNPIATALVDDGNSILEITRSGRDSEAGLRRLNWFNQGAMEQPAKVSLAFAAPWNFNGNSFIVTEGGGLAFLRDSGNSFAVVDTVKNNFVMQDITNAQPPSGLGFTSGGVLIEYSDSDIWDRSPMQIIPNNGTLSVKRLSSGKIYSSENVTVSPDSATGLEPKGMVILNGRQISLPNGFTWPIGASLLVRNVNRE
jgi:hypothetical protein